MFPTSSPAAAIDDSTLANHDDPGSLRRGRTYAAQHRVRLLGTEPGRIHAACRGSGRATYVSRITFADVMDADGALAGPLTENDIRGLLDLG